MMKAGGDHCQRWRIHLAGGAYEVGQCVANLQATLMRQEKAVKIGRWACVETGRADDLDRLVRSG